MLVVKKILIIIISFTISIFLCELILKVNDSYEAPKTFNFNFNERIYSFTDNIPLIANHTKKRVFIIGDSFAAGSKYASIKKDFPSILQSKYNEEEIDVLNMAIGGKNVPHYIEWITSLDINENDTIVVVLYENDILIDNESCKLIKYQSDMYNLYKPLLCEKLISGDVKPKNDDSLLKNINNTLRTIYLVKLVKNAMYQFEFMRNFFTRQIYQKMWSDLNAEENIYMQNSLLFIQDIVKKRGSSIYFTYFPNTNAIYESKEQNRLIWESFIEFMQGEGLRIHDSFNFLYSNAMTSKMTYSLTDYHPNEHANKIFAEFVYELLPRN